MSGRTLRATVSRPRSLRAPSGSRGSWTAEVRGWGNDRRAWRVLWLGTRPEAIRDGIAEYASGVLRAEWETRPNAVGMIVLLDREAAEFERSVR